MSPQKFVFLFSFAVFLSFSPSVFASTIVDTDITENTTWTEDQSPYVVNAPIIVTEGAVLTIDPGVIVKFDYGGSWVVDGVINALGTSAKPIYFTSFYDDSVGGDTNGDGDDSFPYEGDWGNVFIENPAVQSTLNHVFFRYSDDGLILFNGGSVNSDTFDSDQGILAFGSRSSFKNLTASSLYLSNGSAFSVDKAIISSSDGYGDLIYVYDESSLTLENATLNSAGGVAYIFRNSSAVFDSVKITGNTFSSTAFYVFDDSSLNLNKSSLVDVGDGLNIFRNSSATITDFSITCGNEGISVFENSSLNLSGGSIACGGDGMLLYNEVKATINDVKISGATDAGILAFSNLNPDPITITQSEITGNEYGFLVFNTGISAQQNSIHDNTSYGVIAHSPLDPNQFDFTSNYWGDPSGPKNSANPGGLGDEVFDDTLFTPWLESDPLAQPVCCSNVLFLPGIEASRLYRQKTILGLPVEDQLWEPNGNSDVEDLYMNPDGTSINPNIYTRDVIKESNILPLGSVNPNIYKSFVNVLDGMVNDFTIVDFKLFAYDWRQSVDDIVNNGTKYQNGNVSLVDTLQSLVESSKNRKVTIVAHSNGGLLAKALLKKLQEDKIAGKNNLIDSVDTLILVASPEIGTASAVPAMMHGYNQSMGFGLLVDEMRARELGRNAPFAFGLLPSKEYIDRVSASPVTFVDNAIPSEVTTKLVQTFGSAISSYDEYKNFLFGGEGRADPAPIQTTLPINLSQDLFSKSESLHDSLDAWTPPESLRVIEIAGWGVNTIGSYEYYPRYSCDNQSTIGCVYVLDERPRFTADGDGTVVVPSAQYMSLDNSNVEKYWVDLFKYNSTVIVNRNHGDIFEVEPVSSFISDILQKNNQIDLTYFSTTAPTDPQNRFHISVHSPVTLDAYDSDGNHTGKICPLDSDFCFAEENIPNSSYVEFGEGKYLNFSGDQLVTVKLQGTDIGTFTYDSEKVMPDGTSAVSSFVDIPVTTQTQAEVTLSDETGVPQLALDVTGDGVMDFNLTPNSDFDPIVYLQIMKVTIDSLDLNKLRIKAFDIRVNNIIKLIQKGKIDKAKLKANKFESVLEKRLSKPEPKHPKLKRLSKTDAQLLLDMLNKLLDNLD